MRHENEQPLVPVEGGGAVHPTRLKLLPDAKRLSALPAVKEPLSKLRMRVQAGAAQEVAVLAQYSFPSHCNAYNAVKLVSSAIRPS